MINKKYTAMKKLILYVIVFLMSSYSQVLAQTDAHFSQYMFNENTFNPAAIDISNTLNATMLARQQWVGFENAPSTQIVNASTYLQDIYGGVGLNIINDKLGYENFLIARAFYAYPIQTGAISTLTFGLGAGIINRTLDGTNLDYPTDYIGVTDPLAFYGRENFIKPDFNFGTEYKDPNLTLGFAVTHLHYRSAEFASIEKQPMHYYLYGKYRFKNIIEDIDIEPFLLFKSSWFITQFDLNVLAYYDDMIWSGFSYRLGDAISAMVGYQISDYIGIGYAYDYAIGTSRGYSGGSHEIMISTTFEGFNESAITPQTPRIFN